MNERENSLRTLFLEAVEIPGAAERIAYLERACGDDAALRQRLDRLLKAHADAGNVMGVEGGTNVLVSVTEKIGDRIGRYKLREQIGEGGCGVVYVAEQEEPVRRRVALKVIKLGMDTRQVVARFEAERQALALMDHPNIAKVLDGGATDTGRPYFVMELVRGLSITKYCDETKMSTRERLELFGQVCRAVQHAHQKGIIHRDLKPSNILVTEQDGRPVPKVIDFGVAKATEGRLTDKTLFTGFQQLIGTPTYMSPEQAGLGGLDIDTRSDTYSLGVVLYELLTGRQPFDTQKLLVAGYEAVLRTLREVDPPKPSTRLSTLQQAELLTAAQRRQTDPPKLLHLLRGDLDWIVMKCLEKDRNRRYETANSLAQDLERYLHDEPVLARPPSALYRWRKFARKHRAAVSAAAAFVVFLVAAAAVSVGLALWANRERERAEDATTAETEERRRAEQSANELRRRSYASDMSLAQEALKTSNLGRVLQLLERHRPTAGADDLRDWEWRYYWQHCRSDVIFALPEQPDSVFSVAFSPNGKVMATGGFDASRGPAGAVKLWDVVTRREIAVLHTHAYACTVAFSPLGDLLAASDLISTVRVWNMTTQTEVARLEHFGDVRSIAFSLDGQWLATYDHSKATVSLWDVAKTNRVAQMPASRGKGMHKGSIAFSSRSQLLAIGETDGRIRLMDVPSLAEHHTFSGPSEGITTLTFSPDGSLLASGSGYADHAIKLWDIKGLRLSTNMAGHSGWVTCLAFSPDGKTLASASADQTIKLWDPQKRELVATLRGHLHEVWTLAFSPDGKMLVSGSKNGTLYGWNAQPKPKNSGLVQLPKCSRAVFSPITNLIAGVATDRTVFLWNPAATESPVTLAELGTNNSGLLFLPSGDLVVGEHGGSFKVWTAATRQVEVKGRLHSSRAEPLAVLSQSKALVADHGTNGLCLWDLATWKIIASWTNTARAVSYVVSLNEKMLVTGYQSGAVDALNLHTRRLETSWRAHRRHVTGLAFSPGSDLLATASEEGTTKLWDFHTGKEIALLQGTFGAVSGLAFSPDGQRLATSGDRREMIRLWDMRTHQEVGGLEGRGSYFRWLSFSRDGNKLMAVNDEGLLHVWQAPSWEEIQAAEKADGAPEIPGAEKTGEKLRR